MVLDWNAGYYGSAVGGIRLVLDWMECSWSGGLLLGLDMACMQMGHWLAYEWMVQLK